MCLTPFTTSGALAKSRIVAGETVSIRTNAGAENGLQAPCRSIVCTLQYHAPSGNGGLDHVELAETTRPLSKKRVEKSSVSLTCTRNPACGSPSPSAYAH